MFFRKNIYLGATYIRQVDTLNYPLYTTFLQYGKKWLLYFTVENNVNTLEKNISVVIKSMKFILKSALKS